MHETLCSLEERLEDGLEYDLREPFLSGLNDLSLFLQRFGRKWMIVDRRICDLKIMFHQKCKEEERLFLHSVRFIPYFLFLFSVPSRKKYFIITCKFIENIVKRKRLVQPPAVRGSQVVLHRADRLVVCNRSQCHPELKHRYCTIPLWAL